jgi:putative heme-binding domain-containing protein
VRRIAEAAPALQSLLQNPSPANRRAAAEALGRLQDDSAVPALLAAVSSANDRTLDHSLIFALIEIAAPAATKAALRHENSRMRRAALIALDQMADGQLDADEVCPLLASEDPLLNETALFISARHPEWGAEIIPPLRSRLLSHPTATGEQVVLTEQISRLAHVPDVREFLVAEVLESTASLEIKLKVLQSLGKAELTSDAWSERVLRLLASDDSHLVSAVVDFITPTPESGPRNARLIGRLSDIAHAHLSDRTRLAAMQGLEQLDAELFSLATRKLHVETPIAERTLAANAIARVALSARQREQLIDVLPGMGPMELTRILSVFEQPGDDDFGLRLVQALKQTHAVATLQPERVESLLAHYGAATSEAAQALTLSVTLTAEEKAAKLDEYLQTLPEGDVRRGQRVFHSEQAACFACHAVGYRGGDVGPDLSRIARIRSRRDLLEAILFPSASFVRSYEPVKILTSAGEVFSGTIRDQDGDQLVLQLNATEQRRIPVADIEELLPGRVSVMPAGLEQQLTPAQLADLLAFLESRK